MHLHFDRFPEKIEKSPDAESTTNRQLSSRRVDLTKQKLQTNFIRVGHSIKLFVFCLEIIWQIIKKTSIQKNKSPPKRTQCFQSRANEINERSERVSEDGRSFQGGPSGPAGGVSWGEVSGGGFPGGV